MNSFLSLNLSQCNACPGVHLVQFLYFLEYTNFEYIFWIQSGHVGGEHDEWARGLGGMSLLYLTPQGHRLFYLGLWPFLRTFQYSSALLQLDRR